MPTQDTMLEIRMQLMRKFNEAIAANDWHAANRWKRRLEDSMSQAMSELPR